ncbi:MAG TPA: NAD(P)-dependent oxidoreductase [Bacteroidota bacterium]
MNKTVGFVGLGLMGSAMARRLLDAGYSLKVHNRTKTKAETLVNAGAVWCDSPVEVAASGLVFTMVSTTEALQSIALGDTGILKGLPESGVHIDCSTVSPAATASMEAAYRKQGRVFLHCPVLGSSPQASDGSLLIMAGGDSSAINASLDVLRVLGKNVWTFDSAEQASHAKILCNSFIAGMIVTLAQALAFSRKASVDPHVLLDIVSHSALNSPMYQSKGKSILDGNFAARFFAEHMLKDIDLMIEAAETKGVPAPVAETARKLFAEAVKQGHGKEDYSAVIKVLERN